MTSAGFKIKAPSSGSDVGVFISVDEHDLKEIVTLAKKLDDLGMKIYATKDTARAIEGLGVDVTWAKKFASFFDIEYTDILDAVINPFSLGENIIAGINNTI